MRAWEKGKGLCNGPWWRNGNKVWGHRSGSSSCQILWVLSLVQVETYREKKKIQSFVLKYINSPGYRQQRMMAEGGEQPLSCSQIIKSTVGR